MNHADHMNLLRDGLTDKGGVWADLGSGTGAFTLALADLIGPDGTIYSVDRDKNALKEQASTMKAEFPAVEVHYIAADFTGNLKLPLLDGVVMANSLHFHQHKDPILQKISGYLKPGGRLIVVEYNTDTGNPWVPYPFSFSSWTALAQKNGFTQTRQVFSRPSRFLGEIYSAVSVK